MFSSKPIPPEDSNSLLRHNVYWLLACLFFAGIPQMMGELPIWISAIYILVLGWRTWLLKTQSKLPARFLLAILAFGYMIGVAVQFHSIVGKDAGVALVVGLVAFKALETRNIRDAFISVLLAYFLLLCNFILDQSIGMGIYLLTLVWLITANMIDWQHPDKMPISKILTFSGRLLLQALPIMLIVFLILPRIQGPLWRMPNGQSSSKIGLSDKLNPGSVSQLSQSDEPAFRVSFMGKNPAQNQLYWRGQVFDAFSQQTWQAATQYAMPSFSNNAAIQFQGQRLEYTLTLEPHQQRWLFALDMPSSLPSKTHFDNNYSVISADPINERTRYSFTSHPQYQLESEAELRTLHTNLQINLQSNPQAAQLGATLAQNYPDPAQRAQAMLARYRQQNYHYTLNPPTLPNAWIDGFLFNTQRGFCEHYAASFVFVMRAAGVPARIVTGYQGGTYNQNGNYWIIRQANAHAWAEIWLNGKGWVRIDPTAAIAPERIEQGQLNNAEESAELPMLLRTPDSFLSKLRLNWDGLQYQWSQFVLGYDSDKQANLLNKLWSKESGSVFIRIFAIFLLLAIALPFYLQRNKQSKQHPLTRQYQQFEKAMQQAKLPARLHSEGALDYAQRLAAHTNTTLHAQITAYTLLYLQARYGNQSGRSANSVILELKQILSAIKQLLPKK